MKHCVWIILLLATCAAADPTPHAEFAHPMPGVDAEWSATSLAPFLEAIRDVRILGLGETTHGCSEMFAAKRRIIRLMVEQESVETLVFELSVGEGADLDDYVSGKRDDVREILNGLPLWMFRVEEFEELLVWIREHNLQAEHPVRIVGMESQYCDRSIRHVLESIEKDDPALARELREAFGAQRIAGPSSSAEEFHFLYQPIPSDVLGDFQQLHRSLRDHFGGREPTNSVEEAEAYRHFKSIEQFIALAVLEDPMARAQLRDYVMFVNVMSAVERSRPGSRTIVWSHNEHVLKQVGNGGYDVLGRQLERWYGTSYYALGFDFGSGRYNAPDAGGFVHEVPAPEPGSFTALLLSLGGPDVFYDLRAAEASVEAGPLLSEPQSLRASAGGYVPKENGVMIHSREVTLPGRYDGLWSIAEVRPTTFLAR